MSTEKPKQKQDAKDAYTPVLGLSEEPAEFRDWREYASKTLEGTVFDQP
jgi:hypothetical protein